jgi:hypothetical protein
MFLLGGGVGKASYEAGNTIFQNYKLFSLYATQMHATMTFIRPLSVRIPYITKVKFSLEQAVKAQRGSTGIALLFL